MTRGTVILNAEIQHQRFGPVHYGRIISFSNLSGLEKRFSGEDGSWHFVGCSHSRPWNSRDKHLPVALVIGAGNGAKILDFHDDIEPMRISIGLINHLKRASFVFLEMFDTN